MKLQSLLLLILSATLALSPANAFPTSLSLRDTFESSELIVRDLISDLEKRRGGGGGGRSGSSSSGSSSSGSSSSGSSSSGGKSGSSSSSSSSSSSGKSGSTSSTSSSGGSSSRGSGTARTYGSGSYYAGGASVPYRAGSTSTRGVAPFLLVPAAVAFWPHPWAYPVYAYPWAHPYYYHGNGSSNGTYLHNGTMVNGTSGNWSIPVTCLCQEYNTCGCDDNPTNTTYISSILGNGTSAPSNVSDVLTVATVNGTTTAYINGTLANGTTAASAAVALRYSSVLSVAGYWVFAVVIGGATFLI